MSQNSKGPETVWLHNPEQVIQAEEMPETKAALLIHLAKHIPGLLATVFEEAVALVNPPSHIYCDPYSGQIWQKQWCNEQGQLHRIFGPASIIYPPHATFGGPSGGFVHRQWCWNGKPLLEAIFSSGNQPPPKP